MTEISLDLRQWYIRPFCLKAYVSTVDCENPETCLIFVNPNNTFLFFSSQQHCLDV